MHSHAHEPQATPPGPIPLPPHTHTHSMTEKLWPSLHQEECGNGWLETRQEHPFVREPCIAILLTVLYHTLMNWSYSATQNTWNTAWSCLQQNEALGQQQQMHMNDPQHTVTSLPCIINTHCPGKTWWWISGTGSNHQPQSNVALSML